MIDYRDVIVYAIAAGTLIYIWFFMGSPSTSEKVIYTVILAIWVETGREIGEIRSEIRNIWQGVRRIGQ